MRGPMQEGVIQFQADHRTEALSAEALAGEVRPLLHWRARLHRAGLIGRDPNRYEGAGFGNVSARLPATGGRRPFLVTGTQTGGKAALGLEDLCVVDGWDLGRNRVESHGPALPSSEAMTHGALYALGPGIRFVLHVHSPVLWRAAAAVGLPVTDPAAGYGTPEMAREARRLVLASPGTKVLAMGGHEDGILAFGESAYAAGRALFGALARAGR